jgi:sulfur-carrier protein adenylyltransferase/sulfurtransferase
MLIVPPLTPDEIRRYERHLTLAEVGVEGQLRLKAARVLCVGAGGLGSPALLYLAAAGVGTIGIVESDRVEASNLQRQVIYGTPDVGRSKLEAARERLGAINPLVTIETHETRFGAGNALSLVSAFDLVLDGTDNFPTRYLVNDACVLARRPNVSGSIARFEGQVSVFATADGPCYRCLHPEPPPAGLIPSCAEGGVLGVLPGIIGTIQATEAVKLILGLGASLTGRLLIYDALRMRFREIALPKDPDCPICGNAPTIREVAAYDDVACAAEPGRARSESQGSESTIMTNEPASAFEDEITVEELKSRMDVGSAPVIIDVREPNEFQICRIPGAVLIPMRELPSRVGELDRDSEIVLQCRSGSRSANATAWLRHQGFGGARNLVGGILEWIDKVDPSQPKY